MMICIASVGPLQKPYHHHYYGQCLSIKVLHDCRIVILTGWKLNLFNLSKRREIWASVMAQLTILGAAYGPEDVTAKVWSLVENNSLNFTVESELFGGDPWPGVRKSFVLSYQYAGQDPQLICKTDNEVVNITPPSKSDISEQSLVKPDLFSSSWQMKILKSSRSPPSDPSITIYGAAWGLRDVTKLAKSKLGDKTKFEEAASNENWGGDGWPGVTKTLVVVYTYDNIPRINIVEENGTMSIIVSPPLYILGAAYGLRVMTDAVQNLVQNRQLIMRPVNDLPDTWPGHNKSFVIVYQYGNELPRLFISDENANVNIVYDVVGKHTIDTNPAQLQILGAAYGLGDVTGIVRLNVHKNSLDVVASNSVFSDHWPGNTKTLVIIYQYGNNKPHVSITQENGSAKISNSPAAPHFGLLSSNTLLENDEMISFLASNNKYITCDPSTSKLFATANSQGESCRLTVRLVGTQFAMKDKNTSKYVIVGDQNCLFLTGVSVSDAAIFSLSYSIRGGIRLATSDKYIRLDAHDLSLVAEGTDYFSASTSFEIALDVSTQTIGLGAMQLEDLSPCDQAWLLLLWQLTGGFFLALGLGPYIASGAPNPGLLELIKSDQVAWEAVVAFKDAVLSARNSMKTITLALGTTKVLYDQHLLWKVLKLLMEGGGWILFTVLLGKIIAALFLPEAEGALVLANFIAWGLQLIEICIDVQKACQ